MRATMSKAGALRLCQWWARPSAQWVYEPAGPAAEFGNEVHAHVAEHVTKGLGSVADKSHDDPAVIATARSVVEWWASIRDQHDTWHAEPAYVLDVTGRATHVGNNIGRKYPRVGDLEMAGSADIVGISHSIGMSHASVFDVKTGRRENVEPASENAQLAALALAAHLAHGVDRVRVGLVFPTANGVVVDEHEYDALDLAAWQAELAELAEKIPTSQPQPSKAACRYCPAKSSCPAMTSALAEVAPKRRLPTVMSARDIQSPEHARELYETARAAKSALDQVWTALRMYAEEHGAIDLGGGRAWGQRQTTRESIDLSTRAAVDALKSALGEEGFRTAVELSTTKTAIKDAAREVAKVTGEKAVQVERRTLEALRAHGAVKTNTSNVWDEIENKKESAA